MTVATFPPPRAESSAPAMYSSEPPSSSRRRPSGCPIKKTITEPAVAPISEADVKTLVRSVSSGAPVVELERASRLATAPDAPPMSYPKRKPARAGKRKAT